MISLIMAGTSSESQYVTFSLDSEVFAVPVSVVREILDHEEAFKIPHGPEYLLGLRDVRGQGVPVIDLRQRLGLSRADANRFTVIVVVNVNDRVSGLVVDSVSDVLTIPAESIQPPPELGMRQEARFVRGMAKVGERLAILLDAERLLRFDDGVKSADAS